MTVVWTVVIVIAGLAVALVGYLSWRDRARRRSVDESSADRTAEATAGAAAERYAAERHAAQGTLWDRGQTYGRS
jgi:hypothetical protein